MGAAGACSSGFAAAPAQQWGRECGRGGGLPWSYWKDSGLCPCCPQSWHLWWWGRSGTCCEPLDSRGYMEPTAPPYPPLGTASCLSAPSPLQPCVLVHMLSPAGRVGACKRFALIWLNGKVGKLAGPGVRRGDAAHLGHGERSQFLGCFLMNCFFFPSASVTRALYVSPAAGARGAAAVPMNIHQGGSPQGFSCRQRNPAGREAAIGLQSDA